MRTIAFEVNIPKVIATQALGKVFPGAFAGPTSPVRVLDLPDRPLLPGQVRLKNRLCGLCASDLHVVFSDIDPMSHVAALPRQPRIYLGHEVVSEVIELGPGVTTLSRGDRVVMQSKFLRTICASQGRPLCRFCRAGDYALCEAPPAPPELVGQGGGWGDGYVAHEAELWRAPEHLSDEAAALIEPVSCSLRAVTRHRPVPGDKVLVVGCGTIGLGVLMCLRALCPGVQVFAAARHPQQKALAQSYGATVVEGDLFTAAAAATGGMVHTGHFGNRTLTGGFDVIYDCVGNGDTVSGALRMARAQGAVVIAGAHLHRVHVDLTPVFMDEITLKGSMAHGHEHFDGEHVSSMDLLARLIRDGALDPAPLVTHRFPLADWKKAVRTAADKHSGCIKVAFDYRT